MIMQELFAPVATPRYQRTSTDPFVMNCPVCGHPAQVPQQFDRESVACVHCNGTFVVTEQSNGIRTARSISTVIQGMQRAVSRRPPRQTDESLPETYRRRSPYGRPIAFVIEPRDEVFARLTGDLRESDHRVVRATSAAETLRACGTHHPRLVVASLHSPDVDAWKLSPKLAAFSGDTQVILYGAEVAVYDYAMADFLGVTQLIEYGGDVFRLSTRIRQTLGCQAATLEAKHRHVA
tara:strand:+ start:521 stop:1228 length:708 start_codon:yes stop_codon:yes gene_type:complete